MFGVKFTAEKNNSSPEPQDVKGSGGGGVPGSDTDERRLFVLLSAIEHLHNVDFSPIIVHVLKLLISCCPDFACFAIMDIILKPEDREMYLGPLVTSPVRAAALHEEYEHILHQVMPVTSKEIVKSAEDTAELLLLEATKEGKVIILDNTEDERKSSLPVLGSIAASIFPGVFEGLVSNEVRWSILRE
jgi:hypothetical protein